ncbi:NAD(P)-binding protein [Jaminaea rosea]|uniref:NAD(P)-binding protein n=1 Tax=Jaminaea rosea TaxID=1569628 RepID=A0A316UNJ6_9BASI|nr:NAD(P)-binding protein [Jaminaea rosea]PWN26849.1 NAD(P)-binding protein [Jaminaea rosea]
MTFSNPTGKRARDDYLQRAGPSAPTDPDRPVPLDNPQRLALTLDSHTALFMPARFGSSTACKIVGVPSASASPSIAQAGIPGSTILLDGQTAKVKAIVDSTILTALRTAAGSVLATQLFLPAGERGPQGGYKVVVFGGGRQAFAHAWLLDQVYGGEVGTQVTFVTRKMMNKTELPAIAREFPGVNEEPEPGSVYVGTHPAKGVTSDDKEAIASLVSEADIVCCCTPSTEPLFRFEDLKRGAHVNMVGSYKPHMQEVEPDLMRSAAAAGTLLVDSTEACAHEAGDLIKAGINALQSTDEHIVKELGAELEQSSQSSRSTERRVSVFKSVGVGVQDVRIAEDIYEAAVRGAIGSSIPY